jgi:hypothetical protein
MCSTHALYTPYILYARLSVSSHLSTFEVFTYAADGSDLPTRLRSGGNFVRVRQRVFEPIRFRISSLGAESFVCSSLKKFMNCLSAWLVN